MSSSEGNIIFGVLLAAIGACCLALAMSVQRYGLKVPPPVPFLFGSKLPQFWVWFCGLVIYWVANGLFAVSLIYAPLALLGAIFTTLLVWNLLFGRWLLGEKITLIKTVGALCIMVGVSLVGIATPSGIPTEYSVAVVEGFLNSSSGVGFLGTLTLIVLTSIVVINIFEHKFPLNNEPEQMSVPLAPAIEKSAGNLLVVPATEDRHYNRSKSATHHNSAGRMSIKTNRTKSMFTSVTISVKRRKTEFLAAHLMRRQGLKKSIAPLDALVETSRKVSIIYVPERNEMTPTWLDSVMGVIYPGSLGLDEGIGHLAMKAFMSLLATCGQNNQCGAPILWGMILIWLLSSLATLWWLQNVFRRYDVTLALPIEYGAVMACDALSAIVFYGEDRYMEDWQFFLVLFGVFVIILGILIGRCDRVASSVAKLGENKHSAPGIECY